MKRTRLSRRLERKTKKTFFLMAITIIAVLIAFFKFGIPLLINVSLFISGIGKSNEIVKNEQKNYIAPPTINPLISATNSAEIKITGNAFKDQNISLYVNNRFIESNKTNEKGEFSFEYVLEKGENEIKIRAKQGNDQSDFSPSQTVNYINNQPTLDINTPTDGQNFSKDNKTVEVTGKTDPDVIVTVNDFIAILDENNNFKHILTLRDGDNEIIVSATDPAGNKIQKTVKVKYSP